MQFLLYQAEEEQISIHAIIKDDNIWLTQKAMAALFDVQIPAISKHLKIVILFWMELLGFLLFFEILLNHLIILDFYFLIHLQ